ncbi:MAG: hypothetical protein FJ295_17970 [Planctomycetes bacterium]|nr:hypothetical protein [Planctomycetota bacterium]
MNRMSWAVAVALSIVTGCARTGPDNAEAGKRPSSSPGSQQADRGDARSSGPKEGKPADSEPLAKDATPEDVVQRFLEAAQERDRRVIEQLLTKAALRETVRAGLEIEPPGTPSTQYEIRSAELPSDNPRAAYVEVRCSETDTQGHTDSSEIVWVLRKESRGWRVAGMSMPAEDGSFLTWNFEEPADMAEIRRHVNAESEDDNLSETVSDVRVTESDRIDRSVRKTSGETPLNDR